MKEYSVIFDLDGTLWDVYEVSKYTADIIAGKHGLKPVSEAGIRASFGQMREVSAKNYFPDLPLSESLLLIDEVIVDTANNVVRLGGQLYPKLIETLDILKDKYDLFIVSNSPKQEYVSSFVDYSKTEKMFKGCYSVGKLGLTKGQGIKKIVADNGYKKAVYVGDTVMDYNSAKEADVDFIFASYGFGEAPEAKHVINGFGELIGMLERIFETE